MIAATIPNRPFATEMITGLMLPDGIFESTLGNQMLNAQIQNGGASPLAGLSVYVEGTSHPALTVTPETFALAQLDGGAARVFSWNIDVSSVPAGEYMVSFIARTASDQVRLIKKIFVTRVTFNPASQTFGAETPQGTLRLRLNDIIKPTSPCCLPTLQPDARPLSDKESFLNYVSEAFQGHDPRFEFCPPGYLLHSLDAEVVPASPYAGQYGELPYQDPWWKIILCIIVVILLIAAAIVAAATGSGSVTVGSGGSPGSTSPTTPGACCGVTASGGSSSYVVAGLVAAAAAVATVAVYSDVRDPFRRGQDNTAPAAGELTESETLSSVIEYPEPVRPGHPFAVATRWTYTRHTNGSSYTYSASDVSQNTHVLNRYTVEMPNVVRLYREEPFIVKAEFYGPNDEQYRGADLFVQCILAGPHGEWKRFLLQDDGNYPDASASDGTYTGIHHFEGDKPDPRGFWMVYVLAQDINTAQPNMSPEDAAKLIGGMMLTDQVQISFSGGTCPLVPNGDVHVI